MSVVTAGPIMVLVVSTGSAFGTVTGAWATSPAPVAVAQSRLSLFGDSLGWAVLVGCTHRSMCEYVDVAAMVAVTERVT